MANYTNFEMEQMLESLRKHLDRVDIIGYAAARNTRILGDEINEYRHMRNRLIEKYGEPVLDDNGEQTGYMQVLPNSESFGEFANELEKIGSIESNPSLLRIPFREAIGVLSGTELLEIDWMFEE